ncbi:MAG: methylase [Solirubrobacterales bacterium]|nr:methylase [Solirubrobacterales bacterium]
MLPAALERIDQVVPEDALVLDVGGWASPLNRADHVLDAQPYDTRGPDGSHGEIRERFSARTWVTRDMCAREPWPFRDGQFDFAVCVMTLADVRDPIWVCQELTRVARAGYVEVPTIVAELLQHEGDDAGGQHLGLAHRRWFVQMEGGELVFVHKSHAIHHDWALRISSRWQERMTVADERQGLFWEGQLPARERLLLTPEDHDHLRDDLAQHLHQRFEPTTGELVVRQASSVARQGLYIVGQPVRAAASRVMDRIVGR